MATALRVIWVLDSRQPFSYQVPMRLIGLAVALAASLTLAPLVADAQQAAKIARIGYLVLNLAAAPHLTEAFLQGLRDHG